MLLKLIALFIAVTLTELWLIVEVSGVITWPATIAIAILTGIAGGALARREGLRTWRRIAQELGGGRLPADSMIDGVIILVGGALLLTPGFLTDIVGLLTLIPPTRRRFREYLKRRFGHTIKIETSGFSPPPSQPEVRDTTDWEDLTHD